jgi:hypothetical protein
MSGGSGRVASEFSSGPHEQGRHLEPAVRFGWMVDFGTPSIVLHASMGFLP